MAAILNETADAQDDTEEDKSESKKVMFLTPTARIDEKEEKTKDIKAAPVKGQPSPTKKKEHPVSVQLNESRSNPSKQDLSKKSANQMNVKDLDLSRPPPSLHSNVRPPTLINSLTNKHQDNPSQPPVNTSMYEQPNVNKSGKHIQKLYFYKLLIYWNILTTFLILLLF